MQVFRCLKSIYFFKFFFISCIKDASLFGPRLNMCLGCNSIHSSSCFFVFCCFCAFSYQLTHIKDLYSVWSSSAIYTVWQGKEGRDGYKSCALNISAPSEQAELCLINSSCVEHTSDQQHLWPTFKLHSNLPLVLHLVLNYREFKKKKSHFFCIFCDYYHWLFFFIRMLIPNFPSR